MFEKLINSVLDLVKEESKNKLNNVKRNAIKFYLLHLFALSVVCMSSSFLGVYLFKSMPSEGQWTFDLNKESIMILIIGLLILAILIFLILQVMGNKKKLKERETHINIYNAALDLMKLYLENRNQVAKDELLAEKVKLEEEIAELKEKLANSSSSS